jgi:hypothetical protein
MSTSAYYKSEAARCRELAAKAASDSAKRWLQLAVEYEQLADTLGIVSTTGATPQVQRMPMQQQPMQQQPMQQQQAKAEPDEENDLKS